MTHIQQINAMFGDQAQKPQRVYMMAEYDFELHSQTAQMLFDNQWQMGRMGLLQFAAAINTVVEKAFQGAESDPYAEWYLIRIFKKIEQTVKQLDEYEAVFDQQMKSLRGFRMQLFTNPNPVKRTLRFKTSFPFQAAVLLEKVDYVVRQLRTLNLFGLKLAVDVAEHDILTEAQAIFSYPRRWRYTGVTRKDITEHNQKAQKAIEILQEKVPDEVLNQEVKLSWLTELREKYNAKYYEKKQAQKQTESN